MILATEKSGSTSHGRVHSVPVGNADSKPVNRSAEVGAYFQDLKRSRLLSDQDEQQLFHSLAELKQVVEHPTDSRTSASMVRNAKNQLQAIRNQIVEANLRLVPAVAKQYTGPGRPDFQDFVSEGNQVLIRAVELYDVNYGTRFSTYAVTALKRAFMALSRKQYVHQQRFMVGHDESLDDVEKLEGHQTPVLTAEEDRRIRELLRVLDERERFVVSRRFGFTAEHRSLTYREIGEHLHLSKERVRQILVRALGRLREEAELRQLLVTESDEQQ
ncbi:MAG: sigma-70 family RNA polymerase sigma factor [Planctomycetales bacterium]|nr:sigma-70 family RNA polymerase sigma factor [Planctomycetales bacterium]